MQEKDCHKSNIVKKETYLYKRIPCSKNCGCYLQQAVCDLKKDVMMRCKALEKVIGSPDLSLKFNGTEEQLSSRVSKPSLISCLVARELTTRDGQLKDISEDRERVVREGDRFTALNESFVKSLAETKAAVKSVECAIKEQQAKDNKLKLGKSERTRKVLDSSNERRLKMKEILDLLAKHRSTEETNLSQLQCLRDDRNLDREALKSALRALSRLVSDACKNQEGKSMLVDDSDHDDC